MPFSELSFIIKYVLKQCWLYDCGLVLRAKEICLGSHLEEEVCLKVSLDFLHFLFNLSIE